MNNKNPEYSPKRKASTPYKLLLDKATKLPHPADLITIEEPEAESYPYCNYVITGFKGRTVTIRSGWRDYHQQDIIMIKDYILVSCNCGTEVTRFCRHVVKLFTRMIERRDFGFFDRFIKYPFTDSAFFEKYLKLKANYYYEVTVVPKPEYGHIYNYENAIAPRRFIQYPSFFPLPVKTNEEDSGLVAYVIAAHSDFKVPFLIPCRALGNAEGTAIRSFVNFYDPILAPERLDTAGKLLHSYSPFKL